MKLNLQLFPIQTHISIQLYIHIIGNEFVLSFYISILDSIWEKIKSLYLFLFSYYLIQKNYLVKNGNFYDSELQSNRLPSPLLLLFFGKFYHKPTRFLSDFIVSDFLVNPFYSTAPFFHIYLYISSSYITLKYLAAEGIRTRALKRIPINSFLGKRRQNPAALKARVILGR